MSFLPNLALRESNSCAEVASDDGDDERRDTAILAAVKQEYGKHATALFVRLDQKVWSWIHWKKNAGRFMKENALAAIRVTQVQKIDQYGAASAPELVCMIIGERGESLVRAAEYLVSDGPYPGPDGSSGRASRLGWRHWPWTPTWVDDWICRKVWYLYFAFVCSASELIRNSLRFDKQ